MLTITIHGHFPTNLCFFGYPCPRLIVRLYKIGFDSVAAGYSKNMPSSIEVLIEYPSHLVRLGLNEFSRNF